MKIFLGLFGVLIILAAVGAFLNAESVMHQIVGATLGVMGATMLAGAGIIEAINCIPKNQAMYEAKRTIAVREMQARTVAASAAKSS